MVCAYERGGMNAWVGQVGQPTHHALAHGKSALGFPNNYAFVPTEHYAGNIELQKGNKGQINKGSVGDSVESG